MDASSQTQDVMRSWIEAQQQLMTSWMDTVRGLSAGPAVKGWSDFVAAWQQSVMQGLDMQAEWVRRWTENLVATEGTPEQLREQIRAGQDMLQTWSRAQRELWQNWFEAMKSVNPGMDVGSVARMGQNMQQLWNDSMQCLIDTQSEWARRWMTGVGGPQAER
jgi:urease accessory protein UreF